VLKKKCENPVPVLSLPEPTFVNKLRLQGLKSTCTNNLSIKKTLLVLRIKALES
jgi:hypothetical protein